jgi:hypothetical protein
VRLALALGAMRGYHQAAFKRVSFTNRFPGAVRRGLFWSSWLMVGRGLERIAPVEVRFLPASLLQTSDYPRGGKRGGIFRFCRSYQAPSRRVETMMWGQAGIFIDDDILVDDLDMVASLARQEQEERWRAAYRAKYGRQDRTGVFMAGLCLLACAFSWVGCNMLHARLGQPSGVAAK